MVAVCCQKETHTVVKPSNQPVAAAWRNRLPAHALCAVMLAGLGSPGGAWAADDPAPVPEPAASAASDAASVPALQVEVAPEAASAAQLQTQTQTPKKRRFRTATDFDPAYGLELKMYVNRLSFLFRNEFPAVPGALPGQSLNRVLDPSRRLIRFPRPLVVALLYNAEGKYVDFEYIERTGNFHTDTDAGRAFQRSVWLLSPPPIPPGSTGWFKIWVRVDDRNFILAPAEE